jgi:hypothetical protein
MVQILSAQWDHHPTLLSQIKVVQPLGLVVGLTVAQLQTVQPVVRTLQSTDHVERLLKIIFIMTQVLEFLRYVQVAQLL